MQFRFGVIAAIGVSGALSLAFAEPAAAATISYSTTANGRTGSGAVNALTAPGSYGFFNEFHSPTSVIAGSPSPGYGFYDDLVFSISGATTSSLTSTLSLGNLLGIGNLQVRLYNASTNPNLPVLGAPVGGAIDAWSTSINVVPGSTQTIDVLPPTLLGPGSYVLEIRGNVTGSAGGSYAGTLNLAPVPLPAALPMLLSGLGLFGAMRRLRRA